MMIILIVLIAFVFRLISIGQSFWLDEGINVVFANSLSYKNLILNYSLGDFHPPLYHIILKLFLQLFSATELSARMPSVIFGILTVYVIYLIGKKLYDEKTGLIAATLMATAPLHIYYSQEARMYAMAAFFTSLSAYFFISIISKDKIIFWIGFVVSTTLMLYTDYVPYFMLPTYIIYLFLFRKNISKSTLYSFAPAFLLVLILISPWLYFMPKQFHVGLAASALSPAWASVVGSSDLKALIITFIKFTIGRISVDNNLIYFITFIPIAIFTVALFILHALRLSPKRSFLLIWLFTPILAAFLMSFFIPVFSYFRLIFTLGAFYLIWASAINTINLAIPIRVLITIALIINVTSSTIYFLNSKFQREDWRAATNYVLSNSNANTVVLFETTDSIAPFDFYNKSRIKTFGALDSWSPTIEQVSNKLKIFVNGKEKIFLFQYLSPITDPQGLVFTQLTKEGFSNTSTKDFYGVGFVYEFKKF